ncbi:MAG: hypothetical protein KAQ90_04545, partial [Melioribacteraceae bacterium]|nr:hypothetical protein [Melioribacteraceae bacterium]
KDDIGIDGIGPDSPNYPGADYGEGDGEPSQGWFFDADGDGDYTPGEPISDDRIAGYIWAGSEPNFGLRDVSESDQIGLSSFHAAVYTNSLPNVPMNDPLMWEWLSSDSIVVDESLLGDGGDNVFNFGTGPLNLEVGETQRFSMAILFGNNLEELILNAETSTKILEADYRFAQPPSNPVVSASAVYGAVILTWDTRAEESVDPLSGLKDFQGYKIYRSRDYTFADAFTITDGRGNPFLGKGLAQWDLIDSLSGYHPVEYPGRAVKYFIGDNTGLVHQYFDESVTNGVTYFYAVVAFDGGTNEIPPTENKATVHRDPLTGEFTFETNTLMITPGVLSQGLIDAEAGIGGTPNQVLGNSTGDINISIMDELAVEDKLYMIDFIEDDIYNVYDSTGTIDEFTSKDTVFVDLSKININASSAVVVDAGGSVVDPSKYIINEGFGKIRGAANGDLPLGEVFTITYNNFPVYKSALIDDEDANPVFDGQRLFVQNHALDLDVENSDWNDDANPDINIRDSLLWSPSNADYIGNPHVQYRADWEVRWLDLDTLEDGTWANIGDSALAAPSLALAGAPFNLVNISEIDAEGNYVKGEFLIDETKSSSTASNGQWDWGEPILLRPTDAQGATVSYYVQFSLKKDSVIITEEVIDDTTSIFDTTIVSFDPILPEEGDIYTVRTKKPFEAGDLYEYNTKSASYSSQEAKNDLDNIYVVPNPYVAFSIAEEPGRTPDKRGDRLLQFRNLPPECTIRIYTITGELVETINKNDFTSMATWDLLSFEGQRVAYGVYVYHIDVPGVGEKIGRIAVIK